MNRYKHTKGQIQDNAIEALLHDPLFRQRVEKNQKGKAAISVKRNTVREVTGRPVANKQIAFLPLAFCFQERLRTMFVLLFQQITDFGE